MASGLVWVYASSIDYGKDIAVLKAEKTNTRNLIIRLDAKIDKLDAKIDRLLMRKK